MEPKEKVRYDRALLDTCLERDGATLVGEYEKITSKTKIKFVCKCGIEGEKGFCSLYNYAGIFCKSCTTKIRMEKFKQTNIEKYGVEYPTQNNIVLKKRVETYKKIYGVENPTQNPEVQKKTKKTNLKKYGVENLFQNEEIKKKIKETNMEKYGVKNPFESEKIKEKIKQTNIEKIGVENPNQNKELREKIKKTNLKKYGVEYSLQNKEVREKGKHTNLQKYGVEYPTQNPEVQKKTKMTNLKKYGVEYISQSKQVREKANKTNLEKYGVENPTQNTEIFEKAQANMKKFKNYKMPSGEVRRVQGYEPFALDTLLKMYTEEQIITQRKKIPRISYNMNTKECYYFPDIYIPHENKINEVKSTWTIKLHSDRIDLKKKATQDAGYKYEIWCFNEKGERDCQ
jgi:hypothetical protein